MFIVNQVDLATGPDHVARVKRYVQQQATEELGEERPLFAISTREVVRERTSGERLSDLNEWTAFAGYFQSTLRDRDRVRLKLTAPLKSLTPVLARQADALAERLRLVARRPHRAGVDSDRGRCLRDADARRRLALSVADHQHSVAAREARPALLRRARARGQHHAAARQGRRREPVPQRGRRRQPAGHRGRGAGADRLAGAPEPLDVGEGGRHAPPTSRGAARRGPGARGS